MPFNILDLAECGVVYDNGNLSGSAENITVGRYRTGDLDNIGNGKVRSLKVYDGCKVTLNETDQFGGSVVELGPGSYDDKALSAKSMDNNVSSLLVEQIEGGKSHLY